MRFTSYLAAITIFFVFSCTNKGAYDNTTTFNLSSFSEVTLQQGDSLPIGELLHPRKIKIIDSILLIIDQSAEKAISVYNIENNTKLGEFLLRSRADNEITKIDDINFSIKNKTFWVTDLNSRKILEYSISDLNNNISNISPTRSIFLDDILDYPFILDKNRILTMPLRLSEKNRIIVVDSFGKTVSKFGEFPKYKNKVERYGLPNIYESQFTVNEEESKIVIFNKFTDLIEMYDTDGGLLKLRQGPDCFLSEYNITSNEEISYISRIKGKTKDSYYCPISKGNIIWALYCGLPLQDDENEINRILTFDWELTPLILYNMPNNIINFDIDTKNKVIYGLTFENYQYSIFKYQYQ